MGDQLIFTYDIDGSDFTRAGEASSSVKNKLKMLGVNSEIIRRVAIAMYEGEINMVIHANGGLSWFSLTEAPAYRISGRLCRKAIPRPDRKSAPWASAPEWAFRT